jgi:hypothetical protein
VFRRVSSVFESSAGQLPRSTTCSGVVVVVATGVVVVVEVAVVVVANAVVAVESVVVGEGGKARFALPLEHAPAARARARAARTARETVADRAGRGRP